MNALSLFLPLKIYYCTILTLLVIIMKCLTSKELAHFPLKEARYSFFLAYANC